MYSIKQAGGKISRKSAPLPLSLAEPTTVDAEDDFLDSPRSLLNPVSPRSPRSPFRFTSTKKGVQAQGEQSLQGPDPPQTPSVNPSLSQTTGSLPALQQSSTVSSGEENQEREKPARSGFFSNYKASKSSSRLQSQDTPKTTPEDSMSRDTDRPAMSGKDSTQEAAKSDSASDKLLPRRPVGTRSKSDASFASTDSPSPSTNSNTIKKNKPKPFSLLSRTRSIRDEQSPREAPLNNKLLDPGRSHIYTSLKTAPLRSDNDRSFRDMMSSSLRQRSEDRQPTQPRDIAASREVRENVRAPSSFSSSLREGSGHTFLTNLKSSATKGAGAIHKGLFGKGSRSGSTNEKESAIDDEHYQLRVINLPLIQQTRITRISKRLEDSRDKTEFWMPAFPWRAIDYLNYKGSDVEGLYRVPGSGPQIKKWQRRFDEEHDIDLFEQDDLYDINIVGSMLKAWLRELPGELFPKKIQDKIAKEAAGFDTVPQLLVEELSNLPPFNYYLLFAITCHLSLLLAHSDKNKMDFRNLCICFQPCMKIDAYCFKFLVCDWRDCWKGCKTESHYIDEEYRIFEAGEKSDPPPNSAEGRSSTAIESHDERNVSSSDSSKPSSVSVEKEKWSKVQQAKLGAKGVEQGEGKNLPLPQSQSSASVSTTLTAVQDRTPPRNSSDMRPLSPIKPLSPIGF